jgi:hypothetical protein
MRFFIPALLRRVDRYLLLNHPHLWQTRGHYVGFYSIIAFIVLWLSGYHCPTRHQSVDFQVTTIFDETYYSLFLTFGVLLWWWHAVRQHEVKYVGFKDFLSEILMYALNGWLLWRAIWAFQHGFVYNHWGRIPPLHARQWQHLYNTIHMLGSGWVSLSCSLMFGVLFSLMRLSNGIQLMKSLFFSIFYFALFFLFAIIATMVIMEEDHVIIGIVFLMMIQLACCYLTLWWIQTAPVREQSGIIWANFMQLSCLMTLLLIHYLNTNRYQFKNINENIVFELQLLIFGICCVVLAAAQARVTFALRRHMKFPLS